MDRSQTIRRRLLVVISLGVAGGPWSALAQSPSRLPTVGMLWTHVPASDPDADHYRAYFRDLGYHEGRNYALKVVSAEGHLDQLPALANGLVAEGVDVIITTNDLSTAAAQRATTKVPIVMVGLGSDPVSLGFVKNLRRPEGNITGTYSFLFGLEGKRLEILKEAMPEVARVAILRHRPFAEKALPDALQAGEALKLKLEVIEVAGAEDLKRGFQAAKRKKVGAILLLWSPMFYLNRAQIAALANDYRLPVVSSYGAEVGAFLSYGIDLRESQRRACSYANRLLKGAQPSDLPVEEVSTLRLRVNLQMAKAMGVKIPESILARADEVVR